MDAMTFRANKQFLKDKKNVKSWVKTIYNKDFTPRNNDVRHLAQFQ